MNKVKATVLIVALILLALMGLQFLTENQQPVTVKTLIGDFVGLSIGKALLSAFIGGAILGCVIGFIPLGFYVLVQSRLKKYINRLERTLEQVSSTTSSTQSQSKRHSLVLSKTLLKSRECKKKTGLNEL